MRSVKEILTKIMTYWVILKFLSGITIVVVKKGIHCLVKVDQILKSVERHIQRERGIQV